MQYIPIEKKKFFKKMNEYKVDDSNPRIRRRKEKIMMGSTKNAEINGYFVYEIERRGTKERIQATKFELEFFDKQNNYPDLIIKKKNWIENLFIKHPKTMKVQLPPQLSEIFEARSTKPENTTKIINQLTNILTKELKNVKITTSNHKVSITIQRSKVNTEKLFNMKKIGRKLLETGENNAI